MVPKQDQGLRAFTGVLATIVWKSVCAAVVILSLGSICVCQKSGVFEGLDEGRLVKVRLEKAERSSAAALARWSNFHAVGYGGGAAFGCCGPGNLTIDGKLAAQSETGISEILPDARSCLFSLDYSLAKDKIGQVEQLTNSLNRILDESQDVPLRRIERESIQDEQLGSVAANLPTGLNSRQIRALIFSELSFADRMLQKAMLGECVPKSSKKLDYADALIQKAFRTVEGRGSEQYLTEARHKLLLLDYAESHRMAYQAYKSALESLANCPH
jgi:hypothetical protein